MTGRKKNQIFGKYGIVPPFIMWSQPDPLPNRYMYAY